MPSEEEILKEAVDKVQAICNKYMTGKVNNQIITHQIDTLLHSHLDPKGIEFTTDHELTDTTVNTKIKMKLSEPLEMKTITFRKEDYTEEEWIKISAFLNTYIEDQNNA